MSWKDRDIKKLRVYARKLGLSVYKHPASRYTGAAEYVTGNSITIFGKRTKTDIIMSYLHELGHHLDWLKVGTSKTDIIALDYLNQGAMMGKRNDIPKKYRKKILQIEQSGVKYMTEIHKKLNLEISFKKVKQQQQDDLFDYIILYKKGRFPNTKEYEKYYGK